MTSEARSSSSSSINCLPYLSTNSSQLRFSSLGKALHTVSNTSITRSCGGGGGVVGGCYGVVGGCYGVVVAAAEMVA